MSKDMSLWKDLFTRVTRRTSDSTLPDIPAGEQPFKPAYTPMHGPGARPEEKPVTGWQASKRQKAFLSVVMTAVLIGAISGLTHWQRASADKQAEPIAIANNEKESDENSGGAVLGAETTVSQAAGGAVASPAIPTTSSQTRNTAATKPAQTKPATGQTSGGTVVKPVQPAPAPTPAPTPAPVPVPQPQPEPTPVPVPVPAKTISVDYTASGFSQTAVSLAPGDKLVTTNRSLTPFQPVCQDNSCGATVPLATGGSWTFDFIQPGSWVIVNKLNPSQTITATVTARAATTQ